MPVAIAPTAVGVRSVGIRLLARTRRALRILSLLGAFAVIRILGLSGNV